MNAEDRSKLLLKEILLNPSSADMIAQRFQRVGLRLRSWLIRSDFKVAKRQRGDILALLRSELGRSTRERRSVSLLLCDVDHFKQINDFYGHVAGDEILKGVALRLRDSVRAHDAVGRYGGEEFLIILNGCASADLDDRAEAVRHAISCRQFDMKSGLVTASVSIGAIAVENWDVSLPLETILKEVDAALYRAKAAGRDQVVYAEPLTALLLDPMRHSELTSPSTTS